MTAGLSLPVGVGDRTPPVTHDLVVPVPSSGVDGLTNRSQKAKRSPLCLLHRRITSAHQRANGGRGRVELGHTVFVHHLPASACCRVCRYSLKQNLSRPLQHRTVRDVRMTRNPATIRGAPEDVTRVVVERIFERGLRSHHVPARRMHHSLRLARGTRRVQHEQRILRIAPSRLASRRLGRHRVRPGHISRLVPLVCALRLVVQTHKYNGALHSETLALRKLHSLVRDVLQVDGLRSAHHPVRGDQDP
mmetsp:Transcript_38068/g.87037  ORF Transcript_38068/g.87037 Transcript_38068/m.87037 type:complete len:248 (+) Transcript_38068:867-1610(+)